MTGQRRTQGTITVSDSDARSVDITATAHVATRLKRLFPRAAHNRSGSITLRVTPEVGTDIEWILGRYQMDVTPDARALIGRAAAQQRLIDDTLVDVLSGNRKLAEGRTPARPPRPYQEQPVQLVWATGGLLLADALGAGKTMSSLMTFARPDALPALVVTLTHLPTQWRHELEATWPDLTSVILTKGTPYPIGNPDVIITNYHKLAGWSDHLAGKIRTVIFDEAQELRRQRSQKYQAAGRIADAAAYRWGLTATPIYNYGDEIWSVLNIIKPDVLGAEHEFKREWCGGDRTDSRLVTDPAGLGDYLRETGVMLRRTRSDIGRELPGGAPIRITHTVDIDEDIYETQAGDVAADLARKILSGTPQESWQSSGELDFRLRQATGIAKARYVADFTRILAEQEPVVLFGWHREVYRIWEERLRDLNPAFYTGTESDRQKRTSFEAFLRGDTNLLIMSLRAGAGLDGLQEASHVAVFGELDWSPGIHAQCLGRLFRDGQTEPVLAYFLVAESGSDPVVADVLGVKRGQSEPMFDPHQEEVVQSIDPGHIKRLAIDFLKNRGGTPVEEKKPGEMVLPFGIR